MDGALAFDLLAKGVFLAPPRFVAGFFRFAMGGVSSGFSSGVPVDKEASYRIVWVRQEHWIRLIGRPLFTKQLLSPDENEDPGWPPWCSGACEKVFWSRAAILIGDPIPAVNRALLAEFRVLCASEA